MPNGTPDRYSLGEREVLGRKEKAIFRRDLGDEGNQLFVIRGFSKDRADLERNDHPSDHVYLDGAVQGPLYDAMRGIYSLDHHEHCIRPITDATCVQALQLTRFRSITALGNKIIANEPDMDTNIASWALLNADVLAHDERIFRRVQPLILLEGNIDSYGLGMEELTGLPQEVIHDSRDRLKWLMEEEMDLKARDRWNTVDAADYSERVLRKMDKFALRDSSDLNVQMDVRRSMPLRNSATMQFVIAPGSGIYHVENVIMNKEQSHDCACIVYHDGRTKWTVKLTGYLNKFRLGPVAQALSREERKMKDSLGVKDERLLNAEWGGGDVIIGAPRYHNGSATYLSIDQILNAVQEGLNVQIPGGASPGAQQP